MHKDADFGMLEADLIKIFCINRQITSYLNIRNSTPVITNVFFIWSSKKIEMLTYFVDTVHRLHKVHLKFGPAMRLSLFP